MYGTNSHNHDPVLFLKSHVCRKSFIGKNTDAKFTSWRQVFSQPWIYRRCKNHKKSIKNHDIVEQYCNDRLNWKVSANKYCKLKLNTNLLKIRTSSGWPIVYLESLEKLNLGPQNTTPYSDREWDLNSGSTDHKSSALNHKTAVSCYRHRLRSIWDWF